MTQRSFRELMESVLWDYRFHRNTMSDFGPGGYDIDPSASASQFKQCFGVPSIRRVSHPFPAPAAFTQGTFEVLAMVGFLNNTGNMSSFVSGDNWLVALGDTGTRVALLVAFDVVTSDQYQIYGGGNSVVNPGDIAHIVVSFNGATNTTVSATVNGSSIITSTDTMSVTTPNATDLILEQTGESSSFLAARFFTTAMTESEQHALYREARKTVPGYIFQPIDLSIYYDSGGGGEGPS